MLKLYWVSYMTEIQIMHNFSEGFFPNEKHMQCGVWTWSTQGWSSPIKACKLQSKISSFVTLSVVIQKLWRYRICDYLH